MSEIKKISGIAAILLNELDGYQDLSLAEKMAALDSAKGTVKAVMEMHQLMTFMKATLENIGK